MVVLLGLLSFAAYEGRRAATPDRLTPVRATGVELDTVLVGGHTNGDFGEASRSLLRALAPAEQALLADHLEQIFGDAGLRGNGRLRIAYERTRSPAGTTRGLRVLAAELATEGRLHTAYFFEHDGAPAYFDHFGRSLDLTSWLDPLRERGAPSSAFGSSRMHPILNRLLPHTGLDLAAPAGTPVAAALDGVVVLAGERGGYGLTVELQHPNGYSTRYAHLARIAPGLTSGDLVSRGETIGNVGMSGLATGHHLHFEIRRAGQPIDPITAMRLPTGAGRVAGAEWHAMRNTLGSLLARAPTLLPAAPAGVATQRAVAAIEAPR